MKPDQERVKNLLTDTVTLLCKNGLFFNDELRIEGLLGVTIDSKDAFFVHISEQFGSGAEHNDGNIIANVLSSKDSSKFLSERRKSHRTDDSPQRSRDSARSTPTRPLSQQSSHSPGIREPRSEKRKSLDTPPGVRVKKERYDDDLMLIDSKRRVPLPHGPLSQDDAEAMRQSYGIDANSLGQIQQVQVAHQLGEVKRQSASHLVDAGGGTFVTSMVRQESGATNSPTGNPWPDLAAQVSGGVTQPCDSQMTLDSLPGSSQWSPAQSASQLAATTQPPSASDMHSVSWRVPVLSGALQPWRRRSLIPPSLSCVQISEEEEQDDDAHSVSPSSGGTTQGIMSMTPTRKRNQPRPYLCQYPGCGNAFIQKRNLRRHEILKHGRQKMKEGTHRGMPHLSFHELPGVYMDSERYYDSKSSLSPNSGNYASDTEIVLDSPENDSCTEKPQTIYIDTERLTDVKSSLTKANSPESKKASRFTNDVEEIEKSDDQKPNIHKLSHERDKEVQYYSESMSQDKSNQDI